MQNQHLPGHWANSLMLFCLLILWSGLVMQLKNLFFFKTALLAWTLSFFFFNSLKSKCLMLQLNIHDTGFALTFKELTMNVLWFGTIDCGGLVKQLPPASPRRRGAAQSTAWSQHWLQSGTERTAEYTEEGDAPERRAARRIVYTKYGPGEGTKCVVTAFPAFPCPALSRLGCFVGFRPSNWGLPWVLVTWTRPCWERPTDQQCWSSWNNGTVLRKEMAFCITELTTLQGSGGEGTAFRCLNSPRIAL